MPLRYCIDHDAKIPSFPAILSVPNGGAKGRTYLDDFLHRSRETGRITGGRRLRGGGNQTIQRSIRQEFRELVDTSAACCVVSAEMCVALRPDSHANSVLLAPARSYPAALFVSVVTIGLCLRFYWAISKYSVNLFFFDEWDLYRPLFEHAQWWRIFFAQHGPHREGVGVVIVSWLLGLTHWNSRVQAFAIGTAIVLATLLAIGLKVRVFGQLIISDAIIPAMFLGLGQWEVLVSAPGPSAQAFPLLLIVAYCQAWVQKRLFFQYVLVIVINFLLIYTGYGIFIAVITLALFALDGYRCVQARDVSGAKAALLAGTIATVSLASFFYRYAFNPAADCYHFPYRNPAAYPCFMGLMFARFVGIKHGLLFGCVVGIAIVVLVAALVVDHAWLLSRHGPPPRASLLIFILTGYTLIYASAAAVGRVCLGTGCRRSILTSCPARISLRKRFRWENRIPRLGPSAANSCAGIQVPIPSSPR
jgi:hypothetical protein